MGMLKHYVLELVCLCSDQQFGQDAVDWAVTTGFIRLAYNREQDLRLIMGEPGKPETGKYAEIIEAYRRVLLVEWADGDELLLATIKAA